MPPAAPSAEAPAAIPAPVRFDPLASFLLTPIDLDLGQRTFAITVPMADFWLTAMLDDPPDMDAILPGLLSEEDQTWLETALYDGELDPDELTKALMELITLACGVKWWTALRMFSVLRSRWDVFGGALMSAAPRPGEMTVGAWLVVAFGTLMEKVASKEAANFVSELTAPPEGYEDEFDQETEEEAFLAAMSMM